MEIMKQCSKCKLLLPLAEFYKNKASPDGCSYQCTKCSKQYYSRPEVKQHKKEYRKKYCSRPEVKQRQRGYRKKYFSKPKVRENYSSNQLKRNTQGAWSHVSEKRDTWIKQGKLCPICQKPIVDWRQAAADHNHKTKTKRGLLHRLCNAIIHDDKPSYVYRNIANYLDDYGLDK